MDVLAFRIFRGVRVWDLSLERHGGFAMRFRDFPLSKYKTFLIAAISRGSELLRQD